MSGCGSCGAMMGSCFCGATESNKYEKYLMDCDKADAEYQKKQLAEKDKGIKQQEETIKKQERTIEKLASGTEELLADIAILEEHNEELEKRIEQLRECVGGTCGTKMENQEKRIAELEDAERECCKIREECMKEADYAWEKLATLKTRIVELEIAGQEYIELTDPMVQENETRRLRIADLEGLLREAKKFTVTDLLRRIERIVPKQTLEEG